MTALTQDDDLVDFERRSIELESIRKNVYVAGSATFPTSSQANPTLTIVAMALRLGAHLQTRLKAGAVR